jgi:LEA14-like dessication related protein
VLAWARCSNLSGVFEKPELQFRGLRVNSIGLGGASIDVVVDVYNPNSYRLGVDRFSYDLAIENVRFGGGETDAPVSVEGRNTATVRLPLDVDWSRLGDVGRGVLNRGSVNYGVTGEMTVSTGFGKFRVPYAKSGRFSVLGNGDR